MQENVEIITNHKLQFWTKIPENGYCECWKAKLERVYSFRVQSGKITVCFAFTSGLFKRPNLKKHIAGSKKFFNLGRKMRGNVGRGAGMKRGGGAKRMMGRGAGRMAMDPNMAMMMM